MVDIFNYFHKLSNDIIWFQVWIFFIYLVLGMNIYLIDDNKI